MVDFHAFFLKFIENIVSFWWNIKYEGKIFIKENPKKQVQASFELMSCKGKIKV